MPKTHTRKKTKNKNTKVFGYRQIIGHKSRLNRHKGEDKEAQMKLIHYSNEVKTHVHIAKKPKCKNKTKTYSSKMKCRQDKTRKILNEY